LNSAGACGICFVFNQGEERPSGSEGVSPFAVEHFFLSQNKRPGLKSLSAFGSISLTQGNLFPALSGMARRLDWREAANAPPSNSGVLARAP